MTNRTRLICMSHVSYNTGARLPVADVAQLARQSGNEFLLIDGAQGPGHIATDVHTLGCHFYSCAGQKWMLGPDSTGALYVAHDALDAVAPRLFGYSTIVHDGSPWSSFGYTTTHGGLKSRAHTCRRCRRWAVRWRRCKRSG